MVSLAGGALGWALRWDLGSMLLGVLGARLPAPSLPPFRHGLLVGLSLLIGFCRTATHASRQGADLARAGSRVGPGRTGGRNGMGDGAAVLVGMLLWIAADLRPRALVAGGLRCRAQGVRALPPGRCWARLALRSSAMGSGWRYGIAGLVLAHGTMGQRDPGGGLGIGLRAPCCCWTVIRADLLDTMRCTRHRYAEPLRYRPSPSGRRVGGLLCSRLWNATAGADADDQADGGDQRIPVESRFVFERSRALKLPSEFNLSSGAGLLLGKQPSPVLSLAWIGQRCAAVGGKGLAAEFGLKLGIE